jgi:hypothetical protein
VHFDTVTPLEKAKVGTGRAADSPEQASAEGPVAETTVNTSSTITVTSTENPLPASTTEDINGVSVPAAKEEPVAVSDDVILSTSQLHPGVINTGSGSGESSDASSGGVSSAVSGWKKEDGPDSNVSVVIHCKFEIESSCTAGYVAEGRPSDFLPTQNMKWVDSCDVIFKSVITDGDKQEWVIADLSMNDD